ncbi:MAG: hypothetical protein IH820_14000 [Bacteroidetes bacterium]|nr:hypothetical protein [Bacteroidota bacterium]
MPHFAGVITARARSSQQGNLRLFQHVARRAAQVRPRRRQARIDGVDAYVIDLGDVAGQFVYRPRLGVALIDIVRQIRVAPAGGRSRS